jgi:flagellar biosynthesis anti-sigma factor FlgM
MKGINNNPALDAYQRVAVTPVNTARPVDKVDAGIDQAGKDQAAKVTISNTARQLATGAGETHNAERVAELKSKVDQGAFQVNSQMVAGQMLEALG